MAIPAKMPLNANKEMKRIKATLGKWNKYYTTSDKAKRETGGDNAQRKEKEQKKKRSQLLYTMEVCLENERVKREAEREYIY